MGEQLKQRHEDFCHEYIAKRGIGVRAAEAAGYEGNEDSLAVTAHRLLRNTKIKARIKELQKEYFEDKKKLGRNVIAEIYNLGMRRMSDVVRKTDGGKVEIKEFEEMGGSEAAINKLEVKETELTDSSGEKTGVITTETKVWLEGKTKSLELLAKYAGIIVDKQEIDHNINNVEEIKVTVVDPKQSDK